MTALRFNHMELTLRPGELRLWRKELWRGLRFGIVPSRASDGTSSHTYICEVTPDGFAAQCQAGTRHRQQLGQTCAWVKVEDMRSPLSHVSHVSHESHGSGAALAAFVSVK